MEKQQSRAATVAGFLVAAAMILIGARNAFAWPPACCVAYIVYFAESGSSGWGCVGNCNANCQATTGICHMAAGGVGHQTCKCDGDALAYPCQGDVGTEPLHIDCIDVSCPTYCDPTIEVSGSLSFTWCKCM